MTREHGRFAICGVLSAFCLALASMTHAQAEPTSSTPAQGSLSPQEYFADRIRLENGQPAVDSIAELYDELDFQRAVQAYVWATPFVSLSAMFESLERD